MQTHSPEEIEARESELKKEP